MATRRKGKKGRGRKRGIASVTGLADALPKLPITRTALDGLEADLPRVPRRSRRLTAERAKRGTPVYADNYPSRSPSGSKPKVPVIIRGTKRPHNKIKGATHTAKKRARRKSPPPPQHVQDPKRKPTEHFGPPHVQGPKMIDVDDLVKKLQEMNMQ